jgi:Ser/Thr protein kinase RdoA (MazF antagonist)
MSIPKQSIESEVQVVPDIMSFLDLGASQEVTPISEGISNHNYIVKTAQGEYVVRFLVTQSPENIENDVAIQNQLVQARVKTSVYIPNKDEQYIYSGYNISAVVSEKIVGVIPRKTTENLAADIGQNLARFHTSVTQLPHPNRRGLMNPEVSGIHSDIFAKALPKGIIHGDLHLGNVLVDQASQDEVVAILDFEEAGENLYIVDLAVTIMGICFPPDDETLFDPDLMQATHNGYESVRKLSKEEKEWLPKAMEYAAEAWIKWFRDNGFDKYAEKHQLRLDSFILSARDQFEITS